MCEWAVFRDRREPDQQADRWNVRTVERSRFLGVVEAPDKGRALARAALKWPVGPVRVQSLISLEVGWDV